MVAIEYIEGDKFAKQHITNRREIHLRGGLGLQAVNTNGEKLSATG